MNTLVTGGAGFIGSHLVDALLLQNHKVIVIDDLSTGRLENLSEVKSNKNLQIVDESITEKEKISEYFSNIDWVFHLAGLADIVPSISNPENYFRVNSLGTMNVLELSRNNGVKRFIYAASSSCYGIPKLYPTPESSDIQVEYPYALTKYLGEECVLHWGKVYDLPVISLRLFNVYGPRSRTTGTYGAVFGVFLAQKINNKPLTVVGDGTQLRDFTFVSDVVNAFLNAADSTVRQEIFNVGSGSPQSVNRLVELLECEDIEYIPKRPGEPDCTHADVSKIKEILGWEAKFSFSSGVKIMLDNLKDWENAPLWTSDTIKKETEDWFSKLSDS
ncbi:MAG: SDR family oxidoreductase [bacterium]|jgi:UDP-glucose 4-epimerase|tara:strand:- start:125 stop:1117 length:993 start_codon:yes stop_codon:yes gene_type:complete